MSYLPFDSTKNKIKKSWDKTVVNENNLTNLIKKQRKVSINKTTSINQHKKRIEENNIIRTGTLIFSKDSGYFYFYEIVNLEFIPIGFIPGIKICSITQPPTGISVIGEINTCFQQNSGDLLSKKCYNLLISGFYVYDTSINLDLYWDSGTATYKYNEIPYTVRVEIPNLYMKNTVINQTV
jgi:hypothetical protein